MHSSKKQCGNQVFVASLSLRFSLSLLLCGLRMSLESLNALLDEKVDEATHSGEA